VTEVNDSEEVENGSVNDKGVDDQRSMEGGGRLRHRGACSSTNVRTTGRLGTLLAEFLHSSTLKLRNCI